MINLINDKNMVFGTIFWVLDFTLTFQKNKARYIELTVTIKILSNCIIGAI